VQTTPLAYLKDRLHLPAGKQLSSGEKQRILLARCLSYQPEVLILDETLGALDEASAQESLRLVLAQVPTVILVTHQQWLFQGFKHIYRLEAGKLKKV
jgi:iron complex transport system ATP-binding protein